jgi:PKD repeat protein
LDEFGESLGIEGSATQGASIRLDFSVPASGNYLVKVSDPVNLGSGGEASRDLYTLTFAPGIPCSSVPEICNNGQDDDGDGLADCEDRNCFNFSGCTNSGNDCANVNISLTETITPESCDGNDGIISLSASGGAGPYTYAWSNNASGNRITGLARGNYSVTATDANGCTTVQSFTVTSDCTNDPCATVNFNVTESVTPESCAGSDGAISVAVSGGSAPYTYAWSDGSGGSNRSALTQGTYTVTVTDLNGCSTSESFTVGNACSNTNECSTASFEIQNQGGGTYLFRNTSTNDPDVVFWQFGDGAENALDYSPTHTYNSSGTYEVTLVVAKNCGIEAEEEDTTRQTLTVTLGNEPLIVLGDVEGAIGEIARMPVIAVNFNMTLASLQGIVDIADPTVGQIQGVEGGLIGDFQSFLFNVNNGRFSFFNSSNNEIQLGERDTLFYLQILLQGEDGDMSDVTLGGNNAFPLEVSDTDFNFSSPPTEDGKVTIVNNFRLDGRIATYWDAAIPNVNVSLQASPPDGGTQNDNQTSDTEGSYLFEEVPASSACVITPEKNTNVTNGLAAAALFAAQRFIIGFDVPQISSPFQIVAGDANCDGRLSTVDLFIIQKVQVGIDPAFPGCPSWVFVPAEEAPNFQMSTLYYPNYPYPREANIAAISDDTSVDFIGVKVGDILGRANPEALRGTPEIQRRSHSTTPLLVRADYLPKQQQLRYQLLTPIEQSLASFQLSLGYDAEHLTFLRASTDAKLGDAPLIGQRAGVLNLSWFSTSGQAIDLAEGFVLQTLYFAVDAPLANLDRGLWLYERGLPPMMHDADLQGTTIALEPAQTTSTTIRRMQRVILYQNQPNPFRQRTQLRFYLPQAAEARLVIRNALGKTVWQRAQHYPAGDQRENVNLELTPGMYFYSLETETTTLTKSMIVK